MLEGLNVKSFEATGNIFGAERAISYVEGELRIKLPFDHAMTALSALRNGPPAALVELKEAVSVAQHAAEKAVASTPERVRIEDLPRADVPPVAAAPPAPATEKKKKTKAEKAANGVATNGVHAAAVPAPEALAAKPEPAPAPAKDERRHGPVPAARPVPASAPPAGASDFVVDDGDEEEEEAAEEEERAAIQAESSPVVESAPDPNDLVPYLAKRTKLQPILFDLLDAGYRTVDDIIAVCEKLKPQVPVLSRVANFAERIPTALEAYGIEDPALYHPDNRSEYDQSERLF